LKTHTTAKRFWLQFAHSGAGRTLVHPGLLASRLARAVAYGPLPEPGAQAPGVIPYHTPNAYEIPSHAPSVEVPTDRVWTEEEMRALLAIEDKAEMERIHCARCGKIVSTPVPKPTIVRAWVECPECVEKSAKLKRLVVKTYLPNEPVLTNLELNDNGEVYCHTITGGNWLKVDALRRPTRGEFENEFRELERL
jgi:DNA-directed RNA polymerase subunit RPC12/RpoP